MNRLMSLHQLIMMRLSLGMILVFVPVSNFRENSVLYRIYQVYNVILSFFIVTETVHTISRPISIRRLSFITAQIEPNTSLDHFPLWRFWFDDWIESWLVSSHWSRTMTQNLQKEKWSQIETTLAACFRCPLPV